MEYSIRTAKFTDKALMDELLQGYLCNLNRYEDIPVNVSGRYDYPYLEYYWSDNDRYPYLFYAGKNLAGFALVRRDTDYYEMAEFCTLPDYRRQGAGTILAVQIIHRHTGRWHLEYNINNIAGCRFWNNLAAKLVGENYIKLPAEDNREYLEFVIT